MLVKLRKMKSGPLFMILVFQFFIISCVETVESESQIYSNDFSKLDLAGFENGKLFIWRNDTIAGYYHSEEVSVKLNDLPRHNYLKISVEILIHDSWDGNADDGISGPDFWYMGLDLEETYRTTFSNSPCQPTYCLYQSYPNVFFSASSAYTSRYVVEQLVEHSSPDVRLFMGAELLQTNSPDPVCDESWSIATIKVSAIQTLK